MATTTAVNSPGFAAQKAAAEARPAHDPRGKMFTAGEIESLILESANQKGLMAAGVSLATFGSLAYAANVLTPFFRTRLNVSGKLASVVMPTIGITAFTMERHIIYCKNHKQEFLDDYLGFEAPIEDVEVKPLALWKRGANFIYRYPFYTLGVTGTIMVGSIYTAQPSHLSFTQKVFHSRVLGQFSVIATLCGVMGFWDYMNRNGGEYKE